MSIIKKQTPGIWITFSTLLLAFISGIIYLINISSEGYFNNARVAGAIQYTIIAIILLIAVLVFAQVSINGKLDKIIGIIVDGIRIVIPAFFVAAAITLVSSRVQGFAFIYFSNEEVLQEVQTAANISSAHGAIANIIALSTTALVGMIAAFFTFKKKEA